MHKINKRNVKEVAIWTLKKLLSSYMNHLLHSFLLLMEFCRSSLTYAIIVNVLCTYYCWCNFSYRQNLYRHFLKKLSSFSTFTINVRIYLTCVNKVDHFKASMLSSTGIISLALLVSMYYCLLSNLNFFLLIVVGLCSEFLCVRFSCYFVAYF